MQGLPKANKRVNNTGLKDYYAWFIQTFDNDWGRKVIYHLEWYAHCNFPNYDNVNATYAKAGQQQLVEYIKGIILKAKQTDKKNREKGGHANEHS